MTDPDALALLKLHSDWLWRTDAHGRLVEWSGMGNSSPINTPWSSYLHRNPDSREAVRSLIAAIRQGKPFRCLKLACRLPHSGIKGWLKISGVPIHDAGGQLTGYHGAALNLTGQMMSERKVTRLSAQIETLMLVLDAAPVGVIMADLSRPDWPISYTNAAFTNLLQSQSAEVIGQSLFSIAAESNSEVVQKLAAATTRREEAHGRIELQRRDGTRLWADITLMSGCKNQGGCMAVALVRDASIDVARQQTEKQRDRLEALGKLAGGLAHEINNLLQPACLYTEMLEDELPQGSAGQEFLKDIGSGLEQIRSIVKNTLQFARKDEKTETLEPHPVGFLVGERLRYLSGMIPATVEITSEGLHCASSVQISPNELTQVLGNLLVNAAQAMDNKGRIHLALQPVMIDGVTKANPGLPNGAYVELTVSDSGSGMDEATRARIFEPFFTTKPVGEGTGLGLSVVYGLVTGWGGQITVESRKGHGTTFNVFIPIATNQGEHDEQQEDSVSGRHGGRAALDRPSAAAGRA